MIIPSFLLLFHVFFLMLHVLNANYLYFECKSLFLFYFCILGFSKLLNFKFYIIIFLYLILSCKKILLQSFHNLQLQFKIFLYFNLICLQFIMYIFSLFMKIVLHNNIQNLPYHQRIFLTKYIFHINICIIIHYILFIIPLIVHQNLSIKFQFTIIILIICQFHFIFFNF